MTSAVVLCSYFLNKFYNLNAFLNIIRIFYIGEKVMNSQQVRVKGKKK